MWKNFDSEDKIGSEGGMILSDEEYKESCRITLEKCPQYYAITCGIYGAMLHTVFCGDEFQNVYDEMKKELQEFIDKDTSESEEIEFYRYFTNKF